MSFIVYFFAILTVIFSLNMLFQKKMINVALSLLGAMISLGVLFLSLYATFIGVLQFIVYAGGIMVLFLIMISLVDPFGKIKYHLQSKFWAFFVGVIGIFFGIFIFVIYRSREVVNKTMNSVKFDINVISHRLFTLYLLPFEVISILILIGIVGAIYFGKKNLDDGEENENNS